eukprot:6047252-Amphidinium_carterae.3
MLGCKPQVHQDTEELPTYRVHCWKCLTGSVSKLRCATLRLECASALRSVCVQLLKLGNCHTSRECQRGSKHSHAASRLHFLNIATPS